jgi:putative heme-binding domain-containing protein
LGERYFQRQCSRCHGDDAKGGDETGAPDLTGNLSRASSDVGVFTIIREGIQGTAMLPVPADTPDPTVWQLVTYINSLRTDPANIDLPGSVSGGRMVYAGKGDCSSCHMINGQGGRLGPDLSLVGEQRDPDELKTSLTDPNETVSPRWWTVRVTQQDGSIVEGQRMNEDTFGLRIMDENADLWSFHKNQIQSYERVQDSTMPGYAQTLTESEIDDLVAYLFSLRKEN